MFKLLLGMSYNPTNLPKTDRERCDV